MVKKFEFNPSDKDKTISEILNYVHETVRNFKMKSINENQVILMFEESLLSLINNSESDKTFTIKASIKRFLDTLNIEITVPGREFEFAEEISSLKVEDDDDDY